MPRNVGVICTEALTAKTMDVIPKEKQKDKRVSPSLDPVNLDLGTSVYLVQWKARQQRKTEVADSESAWTQKTRKAEFEEDPITASDANREVKGKEN